MALQARKTAGAASDAQRLDRLTEQSSGTMITTRSMASMDDEEEAVQRINVILKVSWLGLATAWSWAMPCCLRVEKRRGSSSTLH